MQKHDTSASSPELILRDRFGLDTFRPGQRAVIDALVTHRAALAVFPTGGGKSLCYQLPALMFEGVTLVVSPLIALMKDQIDFLRRLGIPAARQDSSLTMEETREVSDQLRAGKLKLLYVAPERFNNERFLQELERTRIALFAVDEAHCISEWGHNFRPDYLKLAETARRLGVERVLALTATATPAVVRDICAGFRIPPDASVVTGFYRPNLELHTTPVAAKGRDDLLIERLTSRPPGPTIVYVTLQKTAERVAGLLAQAGLPALAYHAGLETEARTRVQETWMRSDRGIVVATIAFGMGIDKADVRYVYHYNLPKSLESYSQEIGRAGRDGATSIVELFACPDDVPTLENFAFGDTPDEEALRGLLVELLEGGKDAAAEPGVGDVLALNLVELSNRYDLRALVLRTALVYLELLGVFHQGTPFYTGYELRPLIPIEEIVGRLKGEPATFADALLRHAKKGRIWLKIDPGSAASALGQPRERVVRALEYLQAQGWIELKSSDLRQRFTRLVARADVEALLGELMERYRRREEQEIARVRQVLEIVTLDRCQVNALVGYFGETRTAPCGHCSVCLTGTARVLPPARLGAQADDTVLEREIDAAAFRALRREHPRALGRPRQAARFLCGLTSPALTLAKLGRDELFGSLEHRRFADVLRWCAAG